MDRYNATRRRRYEERVAAKLCVRCPQPSLDDKPHCARCDLLVLAAKKAYAKKRRARLKRSKRCLTCGRPRKDRSRCTSCLISQGRAPKVRSSRGVDRKTVQGHDVRAEVDGYARKRFHGQARRGAPAAVDRERFNVKIAAQILERWREGMELAAASLDLSAQEKKRAQEAWRDYVRQMRDLADDVLGEG